MLPNTTWATVYSVIVRRKLVRYRVNWLSRVPCWGSKIRSGTAIVFGVVGSVVLSKVLGSSRRVQTRMMAELAAIRVLARATSPAAWLRKRERRIGREKARRGSLFWPGLRISCLAAAVEACREWVPAQSRWIRRASQGRMAASPCYWRPCQETGVCGHTSVQELEDGTHIPVLAKPRHI